MKSDQMRKVSDANFSLLSDDEKEKIHQLLKQYTVSLSQVTSAGKLMVSGLDDKQFHNLKEEIERIKSPPEGFTVTYVQSCPGLEQCKYSMANAVSLGRKIELLSFPTPLPHKVKISIAGCRICCTEPYVRDVGVIAEQRGWKVVFGGNAGGRPRIGDIIASGLNEEEAIQLIERCLRFYAEHAHKKQRTARFIEQIGIDRFKEKIL